ncbi:MAG: SpoIIE family protein phosphatase [Spirochaetales bacterium]|nr:SpoIIE family protein phosphatase [Spirochaetales bacterium]
MSNIDIFHHIVKNVLVGIALLNTDNEVLYTNTFLQEHTGFPEEELQGKRFFTALFPDEQMRAFIQRKISLCAKKPIEDFKLDMKNKKGNTLSASLSCSTFLYGTKSLILCVIHDTTRRDTYEKVIEAGYDNLQQVTIDLESAMTKITEQQRILKAYKEKMTEELEIATTVQHAIIPTQFPSNEKIDIWGISIPSEKLGGDYFDIFDLDEHVYGILIADVAGHGVAASLLTTMLKAYFEYYTRHYREPEKVFSHINASLSSILGDSGIYFTALYCILDFNTMTMTSCTAGHDPAICFHPNKHTDPRQIESDTRGLVLGVFPEAVYVSTTFQLIPGCKILLYTDGITEARSEAGDYFGYNRLVDFMQNYFEKEPDADAKTSIKSLISKIDTFYGKNRPNDDRTVVLINILHKPPESS